MLRASEYLLIVYFALTGVRAAAAGQIGFGVADAGGALVLVLLAAAEQRTPRLWISIVRDWAPVTLLLPAYWSVDTIIRHAPGLGYGERWITWDRFLLEDLRIRSTIECCGPWLPSFLELCYLLLYALPPLLLALIYLSGRRSQVDRFNFTLCAGTLTAYALLPLFPTLGPRFAFPGQDLPTVITVFHRLNVWLLKSFDIHGSVFPSGHVAVAFSAAFGAMKVFSDRRWLLRLLLAFAMLVAITTVYARYHYAADAIAGAAISSWAFALSLMRNDQKAWADSEGTDFVRRADLVSMSSLRYLLPPGAD